MAQSASRPSAPAAALLLLGLLTVVPGVHCIEKEYRSKTRSKGQIGCHSCLSEPPTYSSMNYSELVETLQRGGMNIPIMAKRCHDTLPMMQPDFMGSDMVFCPNTDENPGACVKLKGLFMGESFIYRDCWSRMWIAPRPYPGHLSEHCYSEQMVQTFVETEENTICFCEDDLCNGAAALFLPRHAYVILLSILVASRLLLLRTPFIPFSDQSQRNCLDNV
uniref:Protein quiver n=1 Tax=Plectus sambesii TaxID=2011161 RepID=A0A914W4W4_9BILA